MSQDIPKSWQPMRFEEWVITLGYCWCTDCFAIEQYYDHKWLSDGCCDTCYGSGLLKQKGFSQEPLTLQEASQLLDEYEAANKRGREVFENLANEGLIPSLKHDKEENES